jgi:N-acetylmuramic acid 6-phosphate etherase
VWCDPAPNTARYVRPKHPPQASRPLSPDPRITEQRNPRTVDIDLAEPLAIVDMINAEDRIVADAVGRERIAIAAVVSEAERALRGGGRIIHVGAGTSGRLGVLDASEIPPTFGADPALVLGIVAGGAAALTRAQEGAEDNVADGAQQIDALDVNARDLVIGIAASGTTPWVRSALTRARERGATTALVACSPPPAETLAVTDHPIVVIVGPEAVTGSTRMKAGTATKLVLNTITTGAMIRLGKTYGNLMVDLRATNQKLRDRSERIVMEVSGVSRDDARALLERAEGRVKLAIVMHALGVERDDAERRLDAAGGVIRRVVPGNPPAVD